MAVDQSSMAVQRLRNAVRRIPSKRSSSSLHFDFKNLAAKENHERTSPKRVHFSMGYTEKAPSDLSMNREIKDRISSMKKHSIPDFGYEDQIDFIPHQKGWKFFLDLISPYPKREKIKKAIDRMKFRKQVYI